MLAINDRAVKTNMLLMMTMTTITMMTMMIMVITLTIND